MLIHNDAMIEMRKMREGGVDLIVCDVAYRTISGGNTNPDAPKGILADNDGKGGFEHNDVNPDIYAPLMFKVLRDPGHCYIFSNLVNLFRIKNAMLSAGFKLHNILIWEKNTVNPNRWYMINKEFILFFRKGAAFPINNKGTKSILKHRNRTGDKLHPTEKPVSLLSVLIANSSQVGETVFDPMMGSGSTCLVAALLGRNYIGIDIDRKYFDVAVRRLGVVT